MIIVKGWLSGINKARGFNFYLTLPIYNHIAFGRKREAITQYAK